MREVVDVDRSASRGTYITPSHHDIDHDVDRLEWASNLSIRPTASTLAQPGPAQPSHAKYPRPVFHLVEQHVLVDEVLEMTVGRKGRCGGDAVKWPEPCRQNPPVSGRQNGGGHQRSLVAGGEPNFFSATSTSSSNQLALWLLVVHTHHHRLTAPPKYYFLFGNPSSISYRPPVGDILNIIFIFITAASMPPKTALIIGSGLAGLTTFNLLSPHYETTIFESAATPSLDGASLTLPGTTTRVDIPMRAFTPGYYTSPSRRRPPRRG